MQVPARRLDAAVEAALYFVACEALANVVKHADAASAMVTVRVRESLLEMVIADDGIGGVTADAGHGLAGRGLGGHGLAGHGAAGHRVAGQGLANMADRVGALDGEVVIDSPPGRGTRLVGEGPVRVAIAEDSGLFRSSLALLLRSLGAEVTASVASGAELLAAIRASLPDVVILDIRMPPSFTDEGIRAAREIRGLHPDTGILVLSTYAETSYASQLLETVRSGVGYLLKDNVTDADALMESLARVAGGETVVDPAIVRRLLGRKRKPSVLDTLNERELAVLGHMAEGRSNLGIAKELFLSARTVETHVTSVFTKLGPDSERHGEQPRARGPDVPALGGRAAVKSSAGRRLGHDPNISPNRVFASVPVIGG